MLFRSGNSRLPHRSDTLSFAEGLGWLAQIGLFVLLGLFASPSRLLETLVPGLVAAWLLLFIASVRELGASILLMGPHSKVITPSIVESWFGTSSELTAAMALIQTLVVAIAMIVLVAVTRRVGAHPVD